MNRRLIVEADFDRLCNPGTSNLRPVTCDFDEVCTHILIDGEVGGQSRKLITHSARNGFLYTMERRTG